MQSGSAGGGRAGGFRLRLCWGRRRGAGADRAAGRRSRGLCHGREFGRLLDGGAEQGKQGLVLVLAGGGGPSRGGGGGVRSGERRVFRRCGEPRFRDGPEQGSIGAEKIKQGIIVLSSCRSVGSGSRVPPPCGAGFAKFRGPDFFRALWWRIGKKFLVEGGR